jgi:hypothetical protein
VVVDWTELIRRRGCVHGREVDDVLHCAALLRFLQDTLDLIHFTWNAPYVALKQYLSVLCEPGSSTELSVREMQSSPYMPYTMQHLASRLKEVPQAGLSVLVKDMKPL